VQSISRLHKRRGANGSPFFFLIGFEAPRMAWRRQTRQIRYHFALVNGQ